MSSILKALKKLEDDKAARRPDELKIDAEILRSDNSPRVSTAVVLLVSVLLIAGGSGVTYMYMKPDKAPEFTKPDSPAPSRQSQAPVAAAPAIKAEQLPAAVEVVPARQHSSVKTESARPYQTPMPARTAPAAEPHPRPVQPVVVSKPVERVKTTLSPSPAPLSTTSVKVVPALRVNGIAFNDGGADSVAMINGMPVSIGSVVEGVHVEEIHKNRVRFSYNGEMFEIPLGQSNR